MTYTADRLTYAEVAALSGRSYDAIRKAANRGQLSAVGRGEVLIDDMLYAMVPPAKLASYLESQAPQAPAAAGEAISSLMQQVLVSPAVQSWYLGEGYPRHVVESCTYLAGSFRLLDTIRSKAAARQWGFESATEVAEAMREWLLGYRIGGMSLHNFNVGNLRVFRRKAAPFRDLRDLLTLEELRQDEGWLTALESLPSGKLGNQHRRYPEFHYALILRLYRDEMRAEGLGAKPDGEEIHRRYVLMLYHQRREMAAAGKVIDEQDWEAMSARTVTRYIASAEVQALHGGARHGKAWEKRHARPHHRRGKPSIFGTLTGDGVSLGTLVAPGPNSSRTRSESLYVWMWRDWATGATLGWRFGRGGESIDMVTQSLGDVYRRLGRLPAVVQVDDKMRKKPQVRDFFQRLGMEVQGKEFYNPQELYAETGNREFNRIHRRVDTDWVNRTAHAENFRRDWEDLKEGKRIKTEQEAIALVERIIAIQNGTPRESLNGLSPLEALQQGLEQVQGREVDARYAAFYFGMRRITTVRKGVFQLTPEASGQQYEYVLQDYAQYLPANADRLKVLACWLDPGEVHVFTEGEAYLATCRQRGRYNPNPWEQTQADKDEIARQSAEVERYERAKREAAAKLQQVEELYDLDYDTLVADLRHSRWSDAIERGTLPDVPAQGGPVAPDPEPETPAEDGPIYDEFLLYRKRDTK